jgi:hypothetical protein
MHSSADAYCLSTKARASIDQSRNKPAWTALIVQDGSALRERFNQNPRDINLLSRGESVDTLTVSRHAANCNVKKAGNKPGLRED